MATVNPLLTDWDKVEKLVSRARQLRATFPNNHFISDNDKREIFEKIAKDILLLIAVD